MTAKNNINYIQGNIIDAFNENKINTIAHQCNCISRNVSGFANVLFSKYSDLHATHNIFIDEKIDVFGKILEYQINNKFIVNMYSQYYPGGPSNKLFRINENEIKVDNLETREKALIQCLKQVYNLNLPDNQSIILGIPLIASGLASDKTLKSNKTDLEYFKLYIEPILQDLLSETNFKINVYYL